MTIQQKIGIVNTLLPAVNDLITAHNKTRTLLKSFVDQKVTKKDVLCISQLARPATLLDITHIMVALYWMLYEKEPFFEAMKSAPFFDNMEEHYESASHISEGRHLINGVLKILELTIEDLKADSTTLFYFLTELWMGNFLVEGNEVVKTTQAYLKEKRKRHPSKQLSKDGPT